MLKYGCVYLIFYQIFLLAQLQSIYIYSATYFLAWGQIILRKIVVYSLKGEFLYEDRKH